MRLFGGFILLLATLPVAAHGAASDNAQPAADNLSAGVVKVFALSSISKKGSVSYGFGTGFILNADGYVATNNHVIDGAKRFFVLPDGQRIGLMDGFKEHNAKVIWSSRDLDLALLKIDAEKLPTLGLKPVPLTSALPSKGREVRAIGFPGIADNATVETSDVNAESTFSSGHVGRLIEDGFMLKGGQSVRLVQHSAFIHRGNSGGPLIDVCGRVIGVNTKSPVDLVRDGQGRAIGTTMTAGYYYASDIRELIDVLKRKKIDFNDDSSPCFSVEEKLASQVAASQSLADQTSNVLRLTLMIGGAGFVIMGAMLFLALRNPALRQKASQIVETYSRRIRTPSQDAHARPAPPRHIPPAAVAGGGNRQNMILDGYGPNNERYRLIIDGSALYAGDVTVGREPPDARLSVDDDSVSRAHCSFYAHGNEVYIRDNASTNGTFVNGRQLAPNESARLHNGIDVKLGLVRFRVIAG